MLEVSEPSAYFGGIEYAWLFLQSRRCWDVEASLAYCHDKILRSSLPLSSSCAPSVCHGAVAHTYINNT
jgi:hypothetical protein